MNEISSSVPTRLRVEHLVKALGTTVRVPRMSWRLPAGARSQSAYRLRAGGWDSGRVESNQSLLVPYAGPPLRSGEQVCWTVKLWTDAGETDWAEPSCWEMGLLEPADWVARWVEPVESDEVRARTLHPAYLFRGSCMLEAPVARARLYVTAHGIYEFFVNGQRVGDLELTPGFTNYARHLQVQTFDVTDLFVSGHNLLGAIVSDGWFRGQIGGARLTGRYGKSVALLAQLHLEAIDGSSIRIGTGPDWMAATGSIVATDLIEGQVVDFRRERGWCTVENQADGWSPVVVSDRDLTRLRSSPAPPVRRVEELPPIAVTRPRPDRHVVDLGQNINGWIRLTDLGPRGTVLTVTHGEAVDAEGDVTLENLVFEDAVPERPGREVSNEQRPFQVDRVTSAGHVDGEFEPRHTTHGFRYVRIEGHPGELTVDDVTGVMVHTDLRQTGWYECSDERLNRLHDAAVWSFRGNACDIPTDCPTRERAGFTGDWQVFVPTAAFLYDVAGFSTKWLRDLAAEQRRDGAVLHCAPSPAPTIEDDPVQPGSAGWGDAAVIVPWEIYRAYGDTRLLEEQWPSMTAWVEYAARAARERRHADRIAARPTPAAHEAFLWDTGFHFGEWLEPGELPDSKDLSAALNDLAARAVADHGDVATAYLHRSSQILATVARLLGREADTIRYGDLAAATRAAWQAEFIRPDGTLTRDTQASCVRALAFELVPSELRAQTAQRLAQLIREADTHLGTGFLATPYLLSVLADTGHLSVAYDLLFQNTEPSWLTMIDRGATTIWEAWNGIDKDGTPHWSLNHYSKGAVVSFLHRYVAGIRQLDDEPAYRRFGVVPMPGGGVTSARAVHDSPYGLIEAAWRIDREGLMLNVVVPAGTSAEIVLPDGQRHEAQPGATRYRGALGDDSR